MKQFKSFVIHGKENMTRKLDKSLYGLKQTSMKWYEKFDNLIISNEYKVNESKKYIYYKYENNICTIPCRRLAHI